MKGTPAPHITLKPAGARVRVTLKGEVIADSREAMALKEGDYPVVYYFPRKDVKMERLERTRHGSYCPFKGQASYFSIKNGPENSIWTYEDPYDDMLGIKELLAFYPNKVDSISAG
jgi:uncharacterized protein (DUF427 family)